MDPALKQALQELWRHTEVLQEMIAEVLRLAKESKDATAKEKK